MRRRVGAIIGACVVLALAGTTGAVVWTQHHDARRPVGTWHDAPEIIPSPVAVSRTPEAAGRRRVGELLRVDKLLGYGAAPRRHTVRHPGASYLKVHFSRVALLPGDHLTVADPAGTETHRYDDRAPGWAISVTGDTAVVTLHRTGARRAGAGLGATIDRVARGFSAQESAGPGREESVCGTDTSRDAMCYRSADPAAYTRSKAVARLLINGTELCTGWRIGTRNRMLTNNHCFARTGDANRTEVWFNYRCARCGGSATLTPTKVRGDRVLLTSRTFDYTLFTLKNFAAVQRFGHLLLDPVRPAKGQELYVPQHPAGLPTRISGVRGEKAGTCAVSDPGYDGYSANSDVSYYCDTAGGSSGSPVLSRRTNRVVALHHFGGCPNSGVRGDVLYAKLKSLV